MDEKIDILQQLLNNEQGAYIEENLPTLPITTIEDLQDLEKSIRSDEDLKRALEQHLALIGGANINRCLDRVMAAVFADQLAMKCSWKGQKNNYKLDNFELMRVIKASVRQRYPKAVDHDLTKRIMAFLRHAKGRFEQKAARKLSSGNESGN